MGVFEKFKIGFKKSASNLTAGLKEIVLKKEIDDQTCLILKAVVPLCGVTAFFMVFRTFFSA